MKNLFPALRTLSVCLSFVFFLSSCNGDEQDNGSANAAGKWESDQKEPSTGDWVVVHQLSDPDMLNPTNYQSADAGYLITYMFQSLLNIDPATLEVIPEVAKSRPEISEDGRNYTFEIREEAAWDDGTPITAEDFEFSVKVVKNPKVDAPNLRPYLEFIEDVIIDTENPRKFTVVTNEPYFRAETSIGFVTLLPRKVYDPENLMEKFTIPQLNKNAEALSSNPDIIKFADNYNSEKYQREKGYIQGSGPYEFEEWVTGVKVVLSRKAGHWSEKIDDPHFNFYPEKLVFKTINDWPTAITAIKSEDIDVANGIPSKDFDEMKENTTVTNNYELHTPDMFGFSYLGMNMKPGQDRKPLFTDKKTRRAIAHLVDVETIIDKVYYGYGKRVTGPISPLRENEYNHELSPIGYSVEQAQQLLAEAGWKDTDGDQILDRTVDGKKVSFEFDFLVNSGNDVRKRVALIFADAAKKAGIKVNVVEQDWSIFLESMKKHDFDMYYGGWVSPPLPQDLKQIWHTQSWVERGSNYVGFGNAETDKIIEDIRTEVNEEKRNEMYKRFQEIVYEEQPYVFIHSPLEKIAIHKRFRNAETSALRPGYQPHHFWVPQDLVKYKQ